MKQAHKLLVLVALVLALTTMLPGALAYFTTNDSASGTGVALKVGNSTTIEETYKDWVKTLTIKNAANSAPVWVRARAYATDPSVIELTYKGYEGNSNWEKRDDGWCYLKVPVAADTEAEKLNVLIGTKGASTGAPEIPDADALPFDVTVVYEATPVQYGPDGNTLAPNWSLTLETPKAEG